MFDLVNRNSDSVLLDLSGFLNELTLTILNLKAHQLQSIQSLLIGPTSDIALFSNVTLVRNGATAYRSHNGASLCLPHAKLNLNFYESNEIQQNFVDPVRT